MQIHRSDQKYISIIDHLHISNFYSTFLQELFKTEQLAIGKEKLSLFCRKRVLNKGNSKITELRTILQRESQNS